MSAPPTEPPGSSPLFVDDREPRLDVYVRMIHEEIDALLADAYPEALARQWSASPVPKPREDTAERSSGGRPANPTLDVVLDARRLALRDTVQRAEAVLRDVAIALRGSRRAIERAVDRFDGEGQQQ